MSSTKPIVGLCGGIGAGKSCVAAEFERLGCLVSDSDRHNHEVLETCEVQDALRAWWGEDVIRRDHRTDRKRIAEIVFDDDQARQRLESLVYPLIDRRRRAIITRGSNDPTVRAIILDSPLLFESGLDRQCNRIVFVHAGESARLERLRQARGWDPGQLRGRERLQKTVAYKRSHSDFVIDNDGPKGRLRPQVIEILERVVSERTSE